MRSEAEKIYNAWSTRGSRAAVAPTARASGAFDQFRTKGFDSIVTALVAHHRKHGSHKTAEQTWKLLDKFKRRHDHVISHELKKVLDANTELSSVLRQFPLSLFPNLSDDAKATAQRLSRLNFPKSGKQIRLVKLLGRGGNGGAVYLGEDQVGTKYAVKHFEGEHKARTFSDTPNGHLNRTKHHLGKYFEASLTSTCVDAMSIGADQYLLLMLGEGAVDYRTLNMADVVAVFQDLQSVFDYSKNYVSTDIAADVSVFHGDIHGDNLMRFNGRLRLIDFGVALIFTDNGDKWRQTPDRAWNMQSPTLYIEDPGKVADQKAYRDPTKGTIHNYIAEWKKWYREAPGVIVCGGCNRQYPEGMDLKTCMACGSSNLKAAKLRRADMKATANLKDVSPGSVGVNPYADANVPGITPQQYGCMVLTAVLIKEIWCATEAGGKDLGMGGRRAIAVLNHEVYGLARNSLHTFKDESASTGGVIEILLFWFDEMMRRLFRAESFTARDAVRYFGAGARGAQPSRTRRHSMSL